MLLLNQSLLSKGKIETEDDLATSPRPAHRRHEASAGLGRKAQDARRLTLRRRKPTVPALSGEVTANKDRKPKHRSEAQPYVQGNQVKNQALASVEKSPTVWSRNADTRRMCSGAAASD